jgi:hypothetical protein
VEGVQSAKVTVLLSNLGSDPLLGSAQLVDQMIAKETQEWTEYVKIANIEPQ